MNIAHYAKFLVAILGVVLAAVAGALADDVITLDEAVNLSIVSLGAFGTYLVPNLDEGPGRYAKMIVGALTAGAVLLASITTDGITLGEWLMVGAAILTALTTYVVPNAPELVAIGQHTDGTTTAVYVGQDHTAQADGGGDVGLAPASS